MVELDSVNDLSISAHHTRFIDQNNSTLSVLTAGLFADQLKDIDHLCYPRVDYDEWLISGWKVTLKSEF
jgi:hypothetical protein